MEDDLIRIFGDSRAQFMSGLFAGQTPDQPMQSRMLAKVIESAQKRVEGRHFSMRKTVLQYDDVNNRQRKAIFAERNRLLDGGNVHEEVLQMASEYAREVLERACGGELDTDKWNLDQVNYVLHAFFKGNDSTFYYLYYGGLYDNDFEQPILTPDNVKSAKQVHELLTERAKAMLQFRLDSPKRPGDLPFDEAERNILLGYIDHLWIKHIDALDNLRQGIGLQAIGQRDPLTEYKKEAYEMFEKLNDLIKFNVVARLLSDRFDDRYNPDRQKKYNIELNPTLKLNGPCPCGSGKKYKNCCYGKVPEEVLRGETAQDDEVDIVTDDTTDISDGQNK